MAEFKFPRYGKRVQEENEEFDKKFAPREKEIARTSALIVNADLEKSSHGQLVKPKPARNGWSTCARRERTSSSGRTT